MMNGKDDWKQHHGKTFEGLSMKLFHRFPPHSIQCAKFHFNSPWKLLEHESFPRFPFKFFPLKSGDG